MENVAFLTRKKLTMDKFSTQIKVSVSSPIKKILNVDATAVISSCDQLNGCISLSGKIKVNVIFVNKLDNIEHTETFFDFIEKQQQDIQLEDILAKDSVNLKSVSFSGTEAICVFDHNVTLLGNFSYEIPSFSDCDKSFVINNSSFESQKFVTSCEDNFVVAEETESNLSEISVLSSTASVIVTDINSLVDKISVEGKIISNIMYSDEQGIGHFSKEFEFKQEVEANGALPNMNVSSDVIMKNITVTPEENDGKTNFVYAFDLYIKANVYEEFNYEIVEDMFSLKNQIQTTYDYIEAKTYSKIKNFADTMMLSEDISKLDNFDDVLNVYLPKFVLENVEEGDEKALISGLIISQTIYKTENDISVLETSLPVKFEITKDKGENVGEIQVTPEISSFKVKAGKYLEIIYNINYLVEYEKEISEKFVKSYEVKGEKTERESGIKIYITKQGETLFEVAKSLNVRPETITSQNEIEENFEQGDKIYIYSPINLL